MSEQAEIADLKYKVGLAVGALRMIQADRHNCSDEAGEELVRVIEDLLSPPLVHNYGTPDVHHSAPDIETC
jgi:hypothetical protein